MFNKKYDYLVVGAGLFGSIFARQMKNAGKKVLIVEKRSHLGGNVYTKNTEGTDIHVYGPHIFHTSNAEVWNYVNQFATFSQYKHTGKAKFKGKIYSLPFNLMTFNQFWGCTTPGEAKQELNKRRIKIESPQNLEEQALSQVGEEIYHTLIYGYTKKQWGREPRRLPASIIKRLPVRFTYDDNYFHDCWQGIPNGGYTKMVENIVGDIEIQYNVDFHDDLKQNWRKKAHKLVYSGAIDELFNYEFGALEYRGLEFKTMTVDGDFQGAPIVNHTEADVPYTRIIEHKHFCRNTTDNEKSVVTFEYPARWERGQTPYYPINDKTNNEKYQTYKSEANKQENIIVGGRLGSYRYFDMHQVVAQALRTAQKEL